MKQILCSLGLHDWEYVFKTNIYPFVPHKYCKRCGKIELGF